MKALSALLLLSTTLGCSPPALAAAKTISVVNNSGDTIQAITLAGEAETSAANTITLPAPVATGEDGSFTIDLAEGTCVVNLSYQLSAGHTITQPNVDLCTTDAIIVE